MSEQSIVETKKLGGESALDPLFGSQVDRKFKRLLNRIQRRMVWDNQQYLG